MKRILIVLLVLFPLVGWSQDVSNEEVTGYVLDKKGPLVAAFVVVKGTNLGTITELDGSFNLYVSSLPESELILQVSYTGYEKVSIEFSSLKEITETEITVKFKKKDKYELELKPKS